MHLDLAGASLSVCMHVVLLLFNDPSV